MDDSKPSIPPSEVGLRSSSERTAADIDPPHAELAKSNQRVAVYYRNEDEVREGFLIALSAMGVERIGQLPEPATPPVGGAKP